MTNNIVNTADVKAETTENFNIPFTFHDLPSGGQFLLDHRNNSVIFRETPNEADMAEALEVLKFNGYDETISLDHLVDYPNNKFLIVSDDLHFSVKSEMLNKVIRPNKQTLHFDLLVVGTNEGLGDIPSFIGYPISDKTSTSEYETAFQYEEGGPRYFVLPVMTYYVPDDEGYKLVSKEKVPEDIAQLLRERELDYIRFGDDDVKDINKATYRFKELFFETTRRINKMLK